MLPALESRLKANVLVSGGMWSFDTMPEIAPVNFAPRITIPTLMINGRYDFTFTVPAQVQLFRLLGTPPEHKRHVLLDLPHNARFDLYINDIIAWLDRYLGPVK